MKCTNCRCIVPDSCDYCMYCGYPLPPSGSTRTIPIYEYSDNVTYYQNVSEVPPRYNSGKTGNRNYEYGHYHDNGYSRQGHGYYGDGNHHNNHNYDPYRNSQWNHYNPADYNYYEQRGYCDCADMYSYRREDRRQSEYDANRNNKLSKILLLMVAADVLSIISVLIVFLLLVL